MLYEFCLMLLKGKWKI